MDILYEDRQIAVIVKPAGMSSQKTPDGRDAVTELEKHTDAEIFPVHRLDTQTRGVMVYAKTRQAASFLSREITEGHFIKEYDALIHGCPAEPSGVMEDLLFKDSSKNKSYVVKKERKGVKKASLEYILTKTEETKKGVLSLVRIRLHTGRTHQIRVQFASRKLPVFGDGKYGANDNAPFLGLSSRSVSFRHPQTGENMTFTYDADFFHKLPDQYLSIESTESTNTVAPPTVTSL